MRAVALAALLLAGCASSPEPAGRAAALPAGTHLPRAAIGAQEGRAVLIEDAQPCYAVSLYDTASPPERLATSPIDRPGCRPWTAVVSADGSTTAVFAFDRGEVHLIRRSGDRLEPDGLLTLPDPAAFPHPPPGRNVALSPDGATLLVGAIDRDCVTLEGRVRCGTAYLYRRGPQGWTLASRLQRPPDAGLGAQFGQTLALLPDGAALVGGTGIIADAGALHLFLPDGRHAQSLLPPAATSSTPPRSPPAATAPGSPSAPTRVSCSIAAPVTVSSLPRHSRHPRTMPAISARPWPSMPPAGS